MDYRQVRRPVAFRLYLITDRKLAEPHGGLVKVAERALRAAAHHPSGIGVALQLREKDLGANDLYRLALALRPVCSRYGAPLIVNDRMDVARAAGADGVHLPADSFGPAQARSYLGPSALVGVSAHQAAEVEASARAGADFAVYGPVFTPLSKPGIAVLPDGAERLAAACKARAIPVFALGGMTAPRVEELGRAPALSIGGAKLFHGVALIGAVFGADESGAAVVRLLDALAGCFSAPPGPPRQSPPAKAARGSRAT